MQVKVFDVLPQEARDIRVIEKIDSVYIFSTSPSSSKITVKCRVENGVSGLIKALFLSLLGGGSPGLKPPPNE